MNRVPCSLISSSIVTVAIVFTFVGLASGETWPRFRGPNGSGIAATGTMPATWTKDDYSWRIELPGMGFSSPVVWDDRVYVTSGDEKTGTQIIQSIDVRTGKTVWEKRFEADPYKKHRFNSYATSTPTLDEKNVYVTWGGPKGSSVVALDRATGNLQWRYEMGPYVAMHNFAASPIVVGDVVAVINDQDKHRMVVGLDCATGDEKWKIEEDTEADSTYATPCCFDPPEGACQLLVGHTKGGVTSLDPATGKENWKLDLLFEYRMIGSLVTFDGRTVAICGSGGGGQRVAVIRLGVPEKDIKPEVLYDVEKDLPYVPTPLIHDGRLYLWSDSGKVKCVDLDTGNEIWKGRLRGKFYSSPVLADGKLYGISAKGKLFVLATGPKFKKLGEVDLEEKTMATPALADGVMYLRTQTHLMALPGA